MPVALVTGASRGFGRALAAELAARGWSLVVNAREGTALHAAASTLPAHAVVALEGDVTCAVHRAELVAAAEGLGGLDLLCNNASELGPSPLPTLADLADDDLALVLDTNVLAPLALVHLALPQLVRRRRLGADGEPTGTIVNMSSDAAAEAYPGWGAYGSSKAALDHASRVLTLERPDLRVYAFDPGDMRTDMHQRAFPGQDISDRPEPESVVPALMRLLAEAPPSGRYRASDLLARAVGA
jgi:NAD(P)-dependent dehydrogenase (short-subunit alcohol dehydrogenase family)